MTAPKPAGSQRKSPRTYTSTGLYTAERRMSEKGLSALDGRSAIARAVRGWRAEVAQDLGGRDALSQAKRTLLDVAAQDVVLLSITDTWLRENPGLVVNKRKRSLAPIVLERLRVAQHLADTLRSLGLDRVAKDVPTLASYMAKAKAQATSGSAIGDQARHQAVPPPTSPTAPSTTPPTAITTPILELK
jgi:hypothetical protein